MPYRFTKTGKEDTSQMQAKQKPQATHIYIYKKTSRNTHRQKETERHANTEM